MALRCPRWVALVVFICHKRKRLNSGIVIVMLVMLVVNAAAAPERPSLSEALRICLRPFKCLPVASKRLSEVSTRPSRACY